MCDGNIDNPDAATTQASPPDLSVISTTPPDPKVMSFNLGVQRELPSSIIADVGYLGTADLGTADILLLEVEALR